MDDHDIPKRLDFDPDDPAGTAARYDSMIESAISNGSQIELRALYGFLDAVRAVTGGFARAVENVLGLPPEHDLPIDSDDANLAQRAKEFAAIEQIAIDKKARVLEFLEDDQD